MKKPHWEGKNTAGIRKRHIKDSEDRAYIIKEWWRKLGVGGTQVDIDLIFWTFDDRGVRVPTGLLEITRASWPTANQQYRDKIIQRFYGKNKYQKECAMKVAEAIGCKAYILLYLKNLTLFWVHCFHDPGKPSWIEFDQKGINGWIDSLPYINSNLPWPNETHQKVEKKIKKPCNSCGFYIWKELIQWCAKKNEPIGSRWNIGCPDHIDKYEKNLPS